MQILNCGLISFYIIPIIFQHSSHISISNKLVKTSLVWCCFIRFPHCRTAGIYWWFREFEINPTHPPLIYSAKPFSPSLLFYLIILYILFYLKLIRNTNVCDKVSQNQSIMRLPSINIVCMGLLVLFVLIFNGPSPWSRSQTSII